MEPIYRVDIDKIKAEAREINECVQSGLTAGLEKKHKKFIESFPIIYDNIINNKMSIEEIDVLLNTFSIAQEQYIKNVNG